MEEQIKRISLMEKLTGRMEEANTQLWEALRHWEQAREEFQRVHVYYYSKEWQKDMKSSDNGELPDDLPQGVLSEDWIYNVLGDIPISDSAC